jgi:hypothetical protein
MAYNDLTIIQLDLDGNVLPVIQTGVDIQDLGLLPAKGGLAVNDSHGNVLSLVLSAGCRGVQSEDQMP